MFEVLNRENLMIGPQNCHRVTNFDNVLLLSISVLFCFKCRLVQIALRLFFEENLKKITNKNN